MSCACVDLKWYVDGLDVIVCMRLEMIYCWTWSWSQFHNVMSCSTHMCWDDIGDMLYHITSHHITCWCSVFPHLHVTCQHLSLDKGSSYSTTWYRENEHANRTINNITYYTTFHSCNQTLATKSGVSSHQIRLGCGVMLRYAWCIYIDMCIFEYVYIYMYIW